MKKLFSLILLFVGMFVFIGCGAYDMSLSDGGFYYESSDSYLEINENTFLSATTHPTSSFSLDTSTAGYANIRRMINDGATVPKDAVKIEEMVNYFKYDYPAPVNDDALAISTEMMDCPWNTNNKIVSIGVKAKEIETSNISNNIVFLLDVSGSMESANKLPLMRSAFIMFVDTLNDNDTISIVTYAGSQQILLQGGKGSEKVRITSILEDLSAGGSTAGAQGIQTAYELASQYFIEGGNNRVILATDGDFNVGISSTKSLEDFISEKRDTGIYLSVLGFGYGNLKDDKLETLANNGNGNYAYIDSITEARKVLVEEIGGTLNVVAKDTKTQVTFNPKYIKEYRLLGYENKLLTDEEFEDEQTDAGEIGAGHVTTAVYEIVLNEDETVESTLEDNWLNVLIRYKDPNNQSEENREISKSVKEDSQLPSPSEDILFVSGVIEMGLLLRNSNFKSNASYSSIIQRLENLNSVRNDQYKKEFLDLIKKLNS